MNWSISPGTMGGVSAAILLLGIDHVASGSWPGPFYLLDVEEEDVKALCDLFNELLPGHKYKPL
jgi:hypothetical protein